MKERWKKGDLLQNTSLIFTSYETLVKELQLEVEKAKEDLLVESSKEFYDRDEFCSKCSGFEDLIKTLMTQVESFKRANNLVTSMWQSSLEEIEYLEKEFVLNPENLIVEQRGKDQTVQELKKQIALLNDHMKIMNIEMEKMGKEKAFYQEKMLEEKAENDAKIKQMLENKDKDIEQVKIGYKNEIIHLQETISKMKVEQKKEIKSKLEEERENMAREEKIKMKTVKDELWSKLNPLMLECEFLGSSEQILKDQLKDATETIERIEKECSELTLTNSKLQTEIATLNKEMENIKIALKSELKSKAAEGELKIKHKEKFFRSNLDSRRHLNEMNDKTFDSSFLNKYKEDDENFDRMILQEVKKEKNRLQDEHLSLKESKNHLEREVEGIIVRLEERNRDLESLNHDLQLQIIEKNGNKKTLQVQKKEESQVHERKIEEEVLTLKDSLEALAVKDEIKMRTWEIRETNLRTTIEKLLQEKSKLLNLVESQKKLSSKWEFEYKSLFTNTEKFRRRKTPL